LMLTDRLTWHGSGNVYCVPQGYLLRDQRMLTLAGWRAKNKSDADSFEDVPPQLDPTQWRGQTARPRYVQRGNGRGCGADVTRILAPTPSGGDRKAAEWVLKNGGTVTAQIDGKEQAFGGDDIAKLPARPFTLTQVRVQFQAVNLAELFEALRGLSGLKKLELFRLGLTDADLERLASMPGLAESLEHLAVGWGDVGDDFTDAGLAHLV